MVKAASARKEHAAAAGDLSAVDYGTAKASVAFWGSRVHAASLSPVNVFGNPRVRVPVVPEKDRWDAMTPIYPVLVEAFPKIGLRKEHADQAMSDLMARGLITQRVHDAIVNGQSILAKSTTAVGDQFLRFIQAPPVEQAAPSESVCT